MSGWNLADTKAMLAEVGVTLEVLSAEELAAALQESQWQCPDAVAGE